MIGKDQWGAMVYTVVSRNGSTRTTATLAKDARLIFEHGSEGASKNSIGRVAFETPAAIFMLAGLLLAHFVRSKRVAVLHQYQVVAGGQAPQAERAIGSGRAFEHRAAQQVGYGYGGFGGAAGYANCELVGGRVGVHKHVARLARQGGAGSGADGTCYGVDSYP